LRRIAPRWWGPACGFSPPPARMDSCLEFPAAEPGHHMVRDDAIERAVEQWPAGAAARTRRAAESRRSSLSSPQRPDRSFTVVRRDRWLPVVVGRRMPRVASTTGMKGCARGTSLLTRLAGPPERLRTNPDHPAK